MTNASDLIIPMFGPMAIWILVSIVFGPFQVWMGTSKLRRRRKPPLAWSECVLISLADGNLFIFAIGTAGGVLAVALMEFTRGNGELFNFRIVGIFLMLISLFIIVWAAHAWTDAKAAHSAKENNRGPHHARLIHTVHGLIDRRDVVGSIWYASFAFICALVTEGLRLVATINL